MRIFIVFVTILTFLFSGMIDDKAYKEYKKGHYKRAFELYKESYSTKSYYNLAVFYERGIGTAKNNKKAQDYYKKVYREINFLSYKTCEDAMLPYYYKTLKKLNKMDDYQKLKALCQRDNNPYVAKCPASRIIPKNHRATLKNFGCFYYKRFPKSMKKLMCIHAKIKSYDSVWEPKLIKKYKPQMVRAVKPIINYYIRKETKCINRAKRNEDIERCLGEYRIFLRKALLSAEVSVLRPSQEQINQDPKLKKAIENEKQRWVEKKRYLQQIATKRDKIEAIKRLKRLHKTIEDVYFY